MDLMSEDPLDIVAPLRVLYRDDTLIAIDKPAGLLVHKSPIDRHATQFAVQMLRDQIGQKVYPCHRLDRPTSGVLLFALDSVSLTAIRNAFDKHRVDKVYHAIVRGWTPDSGCIDYPLRSELNPSKVQDAVTDYQTLERSVVGRPVGRYAQGRFSWLRLCPKTGRTHQLRRHMAHIRHPIIGDTRHGDGTQNRFARQQCGRQLLMLRAIQLKLPHPVTGAPLTVNAPMNEAFQSCGKALQLFTDSPQIPDRKA